MLETKLRNGCSLNQTSFSGPPYPLEFSVGSVYFVSFLYLLLRLLRVSPTVKKPTSPLFRVINPQVLVQPPLFVPSLTQDSVTYSEYCLFFAENLHLLGLPS